MLEQEDIFVILNPLTRDMDYHYVYFWSLFHLSNSFYFSVKFLNTFIQCKILGTFMLL